MTLEKYVSAQWVEALFPGGPLTIKAIGDDGNEYWIPSIDTDVPPWPAYLDEGGVIDDPEPPDNPQEEET